MGEGLAGDAADVDGAAEIMAQDVLSQDDRCTTWPVYAEQGTVAVELVRDGAELWLNIHAVALELGDAASELLGGASLALPELPGLGAPVDVTPDAGGRFLHIALE